MTSKKRVVSNNELVKKLNFKTVQPFVMLDQANSICRKVFN